MKKPLKEVLAENVKSLRNANPDLNTYKKVEKASGGEVGATTVERIEKQQSAATIDKIEALAETFGVDAITLLVPKMELPTSTAVAKVRDNLVDIPVYDVAASMGRGLRLPDDYVEVVQNMSIDIDYLRTRTNFTSPKNLALITAYGNSMADTFHDGDTLLVDRGVNEVDRDDVFVLAFNDELFIKRLQRDPINEELEMISDNPKYKTRIIGKEHRDKFQVLGRVLLAWNVNTKL
jgi:phage repressor protein C with HTH and peptisase S24 domain